MLSKSPITVKESWAIWRGAGCYVWRPVEDWEVYVEGKMPPGIGYSEDRLRGILQHYFEILEFQTMAVQPEETGHFGMSGLWTVLKKPIAHL